MTITPKIAQPSVAIPSPGFMNSAVKASAAAIQSNTARKCVNWQLRSDDEHNHRIFSNLRALAAHVEKHRAR